jgi:hypothetical protein
MAFADMSTERVPLWSYSAVRTQLGRFLAVSAPKMSLMVYIVVTTELCRKQAAFPPYSNAHKMVVPCQMMGLKPNPFGLMQWFKASGARRDTQSFFKISNAANIRK